MTPEAYGLIGVIVTQAASVTVVWIKLAAASRQVRSIDHETKPNSGVTMRDAVDRIERDVRDMSKRLDAHIDRR